MLRNTLIGWTNKEQIGNLNNYKKKIGLFLWKFCDGKLIDGFGPDGISSFIKKCSIKANKFQSGFIYQYAFVMLLGFSALLTFLIIK